LPVLFFPVHVAFLELIIDPTCSIIFEAEPEIKDIMKRPPKKISESILNPQKLFKSLIQGLIVLSFVLAIYFYLLNNHFSENQIRFYSFIGLLVGNLALTSVNKSWNYSSFKQIFFSNKELLIIIIVMISSLGLIMNIPPLKDVFSF